jgi:hypothetical protein
MMHPDVLVPIAGMLTGVITLVTLGWTVRHWVDRHYENRRGVVGGAGADDVARLAERLKTVEDEFAGRMLDLEERVDFTERVLAQARERPQLGDR